MTDYLITTVPQTDGVIRKLYAPTKALAYEWRRAIRNDYAMVDAIPRDALCGIVDVYPDGTTERVR